jgi:hypothetical protein
MEDAGCRLDQVGARHAARFEVEVVGRHALDHRDLAERRRLLAGGSALPYLAAAANVLG